MTSAKDTTINADLAMRVDRLVDVTKKIASLKAEEAAFKAEDKIEGYNAKAIQRAVKARLKGAGWHADQLEFALEVETYLREAGLPVDLAEAQEAARKEAETTERYATGGFETANASTGEVHDNDADGGRAKARRKPELVN
jgi:uncharacterized protein (UPF0335 family)